MKLHLVIFFLFISYAIFSQKSDSINPLDQKIDFSFSSEMNNIIEPLTLSGTRFFDYHSGIKKSFLFNGNFLFPFTIKSLGEISSQGKFKHVFQFVPEVKIRIFQNDTTYKDKSKPVRTPSYIPKFSYLISHQNLWGKKYNFYSGISILHHSNGQDGFEFNYADSTVNIFDGSFSESLYFHYFFGGKVALKNRKTKQNKNSLLNRITLLKKSNLFWKIGFEWHPVYFSNQKFHQSNLYGGNRLIANFTFINSKAFQRNKPSKQANTSAENYPVIFSENYRIQLNFEYITDLTYYKGNLKKSERISFFESKKRLNISITTYKKILSVSNLALFFQVAYFGSDNYNIYFQESMYTARLGLALGVF